LLTKRPPLPLGIDPVAIACAGNTRNGVRASHEAEPGGLPDPRHNRIGGFELIGTL
jgi:hypothetical protein